MLAAPQGRQRLCEVNFWPRDFGCLFKILPKVSHQAWISSWRSWLRLAYQQSRLASEVCVDPQRSAATQCDSSGSVPWQACWTRFNKTSIWEQMLVLIFSGMLEMELRALYMLGKCSTIKKPRRPRLQLGRAWSQQGACFSFFHSRLLCCSQGLSLPSYKGFSLLQCDGTVRHALEDARNAFLSVSFPELLFNTQPK